MKRITIAALGLVLIAMFGTESMAQAGCTNLLGRASERLCKQKTGYDECVSQLKEGKLNVCVMEGQAETRVQRATPEAAEADLLRKGCKKIDGNIFQCEESTDMAFCQGYENYFRLFVTFPSLGEKVAARPVAGCQYTGMKASDLAPQSKSPGNSDLHASDLAPKSKSEGSSGIKPTNLKPQSGGGSAGSTLLDAVCPNKANEPCATAKQMIESSAVIVMGEPLGAGDWVYTANKMLSAPESEARFKEGLKLIDAIEFWKSYIASPFSGEATPNKVIDLAYQEVYGMFPITSERQAWLQKIKAKQAWYTTIVSQEISNLNSGPLRRQKMIDQNYLYAMGRVAKPDERSYWQNRTEHYRQLLALTRVFLYSQNGYDDRHDIVRRVLYFKNNATYLKNNTVPSEAEIQTAMKKFEPQKLVHSEMLKAF